MAVATTSPTMTRIKRVDSFMALDPRAPGCKGRASGAHPQATPAGGALAYSPCGLVARMSVKRVYAPRPPSTLRRFALTGGRSRSWDAPRHGALVRHLVS